MKTRPTRANEAQQICALCERRVRQTSKHHLIPRSEGGREVVNLCAPCHKTLHQFYSNRTLLNELHTIERLRAEPEIARYLEWVRKQPDRAIKVYRRRERK